MRTQHVRKISRNLRLGLFLMESYLSSHITFLDCRDFCTIGGGRGGWIDHVVYKGVGVGLIIMFDHDGSKLPKI